MHHTCASPASSGDSGWILGSRKYLSPHVHRMSLSRSPLLRTSSERSAATRPASFSYSFMDLKIISSFPRWWATRATVDGQNLQGKTRPANIHAAVKTVTALRTGDLRHICRLPNARNRNAIPGRTGFMAPP